VGRLNDRITRRRFVSQVARYAPTAALGAYVLSRLSTPAYAYSGNIYAPLVKGSPTPDQLIHDPYYWDQIELQNFVDMKNSQFPTANGKFGAGIDEENNAVFIGDYTSERSENFLIAGIGIDKSHIGINDGRLFGFYSEWNALSDVRFPGATRAGANYFDRYGNITWKPIPSEIQWAIDYTTSPFEKQNNHPIFSFKLPLSFIGWEPGDVNVYGIYALLQTLLDEGAESNEITSEVDFPAADGPNFGDSQYSHNSYSAQFYQPQFYANLVPYNSPLYKIPVPEGLNEVILGGTLLTSYAAILFKKYSDRKKKIAQLKS
jgi:hypothetical protein